MTTSTVRIRHSGEPEKNKTPQTPQVTKDRVRSLIEEDKLHSPTEIADRLNGFLPGDSSPTQVRFPRAGGHDSPWKAADVVSLLRSGDMEDLQANLTANKPKPVVPAAPPTQDSGISPLAFRQELANDLAVKLDEQTRKITTKLQEVVASRDLGSVAARLTELGEGIERLNASGTDLAAVKAAVTDAVGRSLQTFRPDAAERENILDKVVADTADEVCAVFEKVIEKCDLPAVRRMSEAAANNVGEVIQKIDDLTTSLFDTLKEGLDDSAGTISEIVVDHLNEQNAAFMASIQKKVQTAIDDKVSSVIEHAIAKALAGLQNSQATQIAHFEKTLLNAVSGRLDKIDSRLGTLGEINKRLKTLEDAEGEWNGD